jgi:hypothetical protein
VEIPVDLLFGMNVLRALETVVDIVNGSVYFASLNVSVNLLKDGSGRGSSVFAMADDLDSFANRVAELEGKPDLHPDTIR